MLYKLSAPLPPPICMRRPPAVLFVFFWLLIIFGDNQKFWSFSLSILIINSVTPCLLDLCVHHTTLFSSTHRSNPVLPLTGERPVAARLLRSWVRIPPGTWIFVCCECRVLSGRGLCDELITRPEESYPLCCVVVCDLETSRMGALYIYDISRLRVKLILLLCLTVPYPKNMVAYRMVDMSQSHYLEHVHAFCLKENCVIVALLNKVTQNGAHVRHFLSSHLC